MRVCRTFRRSVRYFENYTVNIYHHAHVVHHAFPPTSPQRRSKFPGPRARLNLLNFVFAARLAAIFTLAGGSEQ